MIFPSGASFLRSILLSTALLLGAIGGVGPIGGCDVRAQEQEIVEPEEAPADSAVEARLEGVFSQIDPLENVSVAVNSGVVRLSGTVVDPNDADRAETLTRQFNGVLYVVNDLKTETGVETRLAPALERVEDTAREAVARLPLVGIALLVLLLCWLLTWALGRWEEPPRRLRVSPLVWQFVRRVLQGGMMVVGLLLAFDILGVSSMVGAVLGTAGVAGLAIGFAFQDIIENYLAGALLSIQQPFGVNDVVEVNEHEGRVVRLTARELVLLTFEGNHVRLPNATVFKNPTTNYTRNPRRLLSFDIGIGAAEDLVEVARIGRETLEAMNGILDDPGPFVRNRELGDSAVLVRFHGWVNQQESDFTKVRSEAVRLVKTALEEAGIDMPEPTYRLQVWQQEATAAEADASGPESPAPGETALEQAASIDVTPDGKLEAQVWADLSQSDEPNLLVDEDPSE